MNDDAGLPSFQALRGSLRRTTERLARELATPGPSAPDWSTLDWDVARAAATMQGIVALLAGRLAWRGPQDWHAWLAARAAEGHEREQCIGHAIDGVHAALTAAGVAAVGLKGTSLRALGLYLPGERPMGDIDLLVDPGDQRAVIGALAGIDYRLCYSTQRHLVFEHHSTQQDFLDGERAHNPLKIEVHYHVAELLPASSVDITATLRRARHAAGLNPYPDVVSLFRHLLLHAAGNMRSHALRQLQLHDIALLAKQLATADWTRLADTPPADGGNWWMYPPLALTARYYPHSIPEAERRRFASFCHGRLRAAADSLRLTDVSWSNLRIHAFPGHYWARSALESLKLVRARLAPGAQARAELRSAFDNNSALRQVDWYALPHARRIIRWLTGRAPRVQTLFSVRSALRAAARDRASAAS